MEKLVLKENIDRVIERINRACLRAGRSPKEVKLIAVTKTVPTEVIRCAVELGITDIGENRVQEAKAKSSELADTGIKWHMIGYLQRNKVKDAIKIFDIIHSVDRKELIDVLEKELLKMGKKMPVMIEVNVAEEETKHGVLVSGLMPLVEYLLEKSKMLIPVGLMTVAPYANDPEEVRYVFVKLRQLRDKVKEEFSLEYFEHLSMGMSNDFEVAIEEGATMVRIGTLIFGERRK